jgi:hypothetical protein
VPRQVDVTSRRNHILRIFCQLILLLNLQLYLVGTIYIYQLHFRIVKMIVQMGFNTLLMLTALGAQAFVFPTRTCPSCTSVHAKSGKGYECSAPSKIRHLLNLRQRLPPIASPPLRAPLRRSRPSTRLRHFWVASGKTSNSREVFVLSRRVRGVRSQRRSRGRTTLLMVGPK